MPKISVEANIEEGSLSVKADGKEISNVSDFSAYCYHYDNEDKRMECSFTVREEENGLYKMTRYSAYHSPEATEAVRAGKAVASQYDGFVKIALGIAKCRVDDDIAKFLKRGV